MSVPTAAWLPVTTGFGRRRRVARKRPVRGTGILSGILGAIGLGDGRRRKRRVVRHAHGTGPLSSILGAIGLGDGRRRRRRVVRGRGSNTMDNTKYNMMKKMENLVNVMGHGRRRHIRRKRVAGGDFKSIMDEYIMPIAGLAGHLLPAFGLGRRRRVRRHIRGHGSNTRYNMMKRMENLVDVMGHGRKRKKRRTGGFDFTRRINPLLTHLLGNNPIRHLLGRTLRRGRGGANDLRPPSMDDFGFAPDQYPLKQPSSSDFGFTPVKRINPIIPPKPKNRFPPTKPHKPESLIKDFAAREELANRLTHLVNTLPIIPKKVSAWEGVAPSLFHGLTSAAKTVRPFSRIEHGLHKKTPAWIRKPVKFFSDIGYGARRRRRRVHRY
jgi:hypothetical protein